MKELNFNYIFFILVIISLLHVSNQLDPSRVNEGASTSGQLTECEKCELQDYASRVVFLLISENRFSGNITNILENNFDELQAFHDEIFNYFTEAEIGFRALADVSIQNRVLRLNYYSEAINKMILTAIQESCSRHFRSRVWYEYDSDRNMILYRENVISSSEACFCLRDTETRSVTSQTALQQLRELKNKNTEISLDGRNRVPGSNTGDMVRIVRYHIIPLPLITQFFQSWLMDDTDVSGFNGCVVELMSRIRRSLEKLLIVRIAKSNELSNELNLDVNSIRSHRFSANTYGRFFSWLGGNVFLGPENRGPFHPRFENNNGPEALASFEHDVEYIIGPMAHDQLLVLYEELLTYVEEMPNMSVFARLMNGFNIFTTLCIVLDGRPVTHMNPDNWVLREPTEEELNNIKTPQLREETKGQKYFDIKKPESSRRPERSSKYQLVNAEDYTAATVGELKDLWSNFIKHLNKISLDAYSRNETLVWSCNFTSLYKDYLLEKANVTSNECTNCMSFDKYLFMRLKSWDWRRCNNPQNLLANVEWCQAWKRIMMEIKLDNEIDRFSLEHSESFLEDVKVFMGWLSAELGTDVCGKEEQPVEHKNPPGNNSMPLIWSKKKDSSVDITVCDLSTALVKVFFWKTSYCRQTFG